MKTRLVVKSSIEAIGFDEKSFSGTILGFTPPWASGHYNENFSKKNSDLLAVSDKIHSKSDCFATPVANGLKQSIFFGFVSNKLLATKFLVNLKHNTLNKSKNLI